MHFCDRKRWGLKDAYFGAKTERIIPKVFISYSQKDISYLNTLKTHLSYPQRENILKTWDDNDLKPGEEWDKNIQNALKTADIILLLLSPDLLATNYVVETEMKIALERHERKEAIVLPIIIRPCQWHRTPFASYQLLPRKAIPISKQPDYDEAWKQISEEVIALAESIETL